MIKNQSDRSFIRYRINDKNMTLIMGAKCSDGIVLVGDKKITVGNGTDYNFADKIFSPYENVVVASSGYSGMYRSFQARLRQRVDELREEKERVENYNWQEGLILLTEQIIRDMNDDFGQEIVINNFQVLMGFRIYFEPELIMINGLAIPQPVTNYDSIGHGDPYASVLLKTLWAKHKMMNMETFSKIGCLAIKYIQDLKLDFSVGVDPDIDDVPQVWFIPKIPDYIQKEIQESTNEKQTQQLWNHYKIKELTKNDVKLLMNYGESNISSIKKAIEEIKI